MADSTQGQRAAGETTRSASASQTPRQPKANRRRLAVDILFPTVAAAIQRLRRGDTVPAEDCGWMQAIAPGAVDLDAMDPSLVATFEKMGVFLPADPDLDNAAPLARIKASDAPLVIDTAAGEVDLG